MFSQFFTLLIKITNSKYWNQNCDPRVLNQWLMDGGPWRLMMISIIYLLSIRFGVRWMKYRKPYQNLRLPMFLFNVFLVMVNLYFFYKSFWWINNGLDLLNLNFPPSQDQSQRSQQIIQLYYYYQLSKFLDYFDTMFLVLRKKNDHLTTLHIYHHVSVPIVGWISNWISPTMPALGLFAMVNSFCHILMYTYYAMTALGSKTLSRFFWWKRYVTALQLVQFFIIGLYGSVLNVYHRNYPLLFRLTIISQAIIYLIMFGNFYRKSYHGEQKSSEDKLQQYSMDEQEIRNMGKIQNGKLN